MNQILMRYLLQREPMTKEPEKNTMTNKASQANIEKILMILSSVDLDPFYSSMQVTSDNDVRYFMDNSSVKTNILKQAVSLRQEYFNLIEDIMTGVFGDEPKMEKENKAFAEYFKKNRYQHLKNKAKKDHSAENKSQKINIDLPEIPSWTL